MARRPWRPPSERIVLDLCGGTGAWSAPYVAAGYDVRLVTLPDHDVCTYQPPADVYGILAAPPCTYFSLARQQDSDRLPLFREGMEPVHACLQIVWQCQCNQPLAWWALENPRGYLRRFLGRPPLTFEQWEYGDGGIKPTDLWGHYTAPKPTLGTRPRVTGRRTTVAFSRAGGSERGKMLRAQTPPGFARAFFLANP